MYRKMIKKKEFKLFFFSLFGIYILYTYYHLLSSEIYQFLNQLLVSNSYFLL